MGLEATTKNYWIAPNAFQITLNALGDANRIQGSVASGSVVSCYIEEVKPASAGPDYAGNGDGLQLDNGRNPKRWPLSLSPTYFNSDTAKYAYVAIPRSVAIGTQAVIVFPSERLDLYGKSSGGTQVGSTDFFYVFLQGIISTPEGDPLQRKWTHVIEYGSLGTYQDIVDLSDSDWYSYSKITDIVTFLKEIIMSPLSSFRNLRLNGKELTDVATAATGEEYVDSETMVVTPSYLKTHLSNKYIRKDKDDETPFSLVVGGILTALNSIINNIRSSNYTGDGVADTGWSVTNNFNGTGMSGLVVDYIYARVKLVAEALEVKKYEVSAGDQIFSSAANYINRTEYLDSSDNPIGYSKVKVPWLLNKMPFLLRHLPNALGIFATTKVIRSTMTTSQLQQIAKIRCYFLAKDDDRDVENWWRVGDLARCQSMNLSSSRRNDYTGVERKAGNVMWWRKVIGVSTNPTRTAREDGNDFTNGTYSDEGSGPVTLDDGKEYHYFDVAYNYDAENATPYQYPDALYLSDIPCAGDAAVQFGNDRDPNRMNLLTIELNGLMNADAPCAKIYRGIYTFDLNKCWWGGKTRKMILSPSTGFEFYGPSFKFVEEHGIARVPRDRGSWTDISQVRDDYPSHGNVRKCYYYDRVTYDGSLWLCVASSLETGDAAHWVKPQYFDNAQYALFDQYGNYRDNGDYISDSDYAALASDKKIQCGRVQNYITSTPSESSNDWEKQVSKGSDGKNAVRLALDNEHEDFLYNGYQTLPIAPNGGARSVIHLYDGENEVTLSTSMLSIDASSSGVPTTGDYIPAIITDTDGKVKLKVPHITADTAKVVVKAMYNSNPYYAEFTGNKTMQDKYDLILAPSSIAYNSATYPQNGVTINASAKRTDLQGTQTPVTINTSPDQGNVRLFIAKVNSDGTMTSLARLRAASYTVTPSDCQDYIGIYIELRYYYDSSTHDDGLPSAYRVCDSETVEIAKAENGAAAADSYSFEISPQSVVNNDDFASSQNLTIYIVARKYPAGAASVKLTFGSGGKSNEDNTLYGAYKKSSNKYYSAISGDSYTLTKAIANANAHIDFELRKAKSGQTYSINDSSTYDIIGARRFQVLKDGEPGSDGNDGEDSVNVIATPGALIVNQDVTNPGNLEDLRTDTAASCTFSVMKGSTLLSVTGVTITDYSHVLDTVTGTNYIQLYKIGKDNEGTYYDSGYVVCTISYTDGTTPKTVGGIKISVYANLLGTWAVETTNAATTAAGEKIETELGPNGAITSAYTAAITASTKELRSEYTEQISRAGDYNRNLFGFSRGLIFTATSGTAPIQFIQGYGLVLEGTQDGFRGGRIANLKLDGIGGEFVVSCWIKQSASSGTTVRKVRMGLCNVINTRGEGDVPENSDYVEISTAWSYKVFHFNVPDASTLDGNLNGYLDIEGDWSGNQYIYVRQLVIERGTKPSDFCEAEEDIAYLGRGQMITELTTNAKDDQGTTVANASIYATTFTIDGSQKAGYTAGVDPSNLGTDRFINFLRQGNAFTLTAGKVYTLSYWARGTEGTVIRNFLYKDSSSPIITHVSDNLYDPGNNGVIIEGVAGDGNTAIRLKGRGSSDWQFFCVHFYVANSRTAANVIPLRIAKADNSSGAKVVDIADIRLQEGYVVSETLFRSLINQNARLISLVQQTGTRLAGIDIENGIINLKGDRVIFSNGDGSVSGKVAIDPETGTLNAVDGNFSGTVTVDRFISISKSVTRSNYNNWNTSPNLSGAKVIPLASTGDMTAFDQSFDIGSSEYKVSLLNIENNADTGQEFTFISYSDNGIWLYSDSAGIIIAYSGSGGATFSGSLIKLKKGFPVRFLWTGSSWCIIWGYFET